MQHDYLISTKQRAKHAILGAMVGDALGSSLEFLDSESAKQFLSKHSYFDKGLVGLGPFNLVPGQFTDDTEMALAIMYVITQYGTYNQDVVAKTYHKWYLSNPFDIGNTTKAAVSQTNAKDMMAIASTQNVSSLSNGFLMRLYGLVGLYYNKSAEELVDAIKKDVVLTHGHPETIHIGIFYGMMLWHAIQGHNVDEIYKWGKNHCKSSPLITAIYQAVELTNTAIQYDGKRYLLSQTDSHIFGFVGFALWLLLICLKKHASYEIAILEVVSYGGDTDTNACIVGAVMGALYPTTIPKSWIHSVTNCNNRRSTDYSIVNPKVWMSWLP